MDLGEQTFFIEKNKNFCNSRLIGDMFQLGDMKEHDLGLGVGSTRSKSFHAVLKIHLGVDFIEAIEITEH